MIFQICIVCYLDYYKTIGPSYIGLSQKHIQMTILRHVVKLQKSCQRAVGLVTRNMSSVGGHDNDHLSRTSENTRENVMSQAIVSSVQDVSQTVKLLSLKLINPRVKFKAGQWVDFFIPGLEKVGGYSMCSSPTKLIKDGTLDLAVKYSEHPPAKWVHTQCKMDTKVAVRVGGDFHFDPLSSPSTDLLLIAGGVGINPLYSIFLHCSEQAASTGARVNLLYSASTSDELVFKKNIDSICKECTNFNRQYFVTKENTQATKDLTNSRINKSTLANSLESLDRNKVLCYICGPLSMLQDMERTLVELGVSEDRIMYEKWW
ncbi:unnamed protein product [Owenia fusiformis]|uniref:Oxidoreductase NAD-binding domain-containing protein 1 n=1 Tax=Owenia fusiformis TaxID=6347 RepID=A0A8J1UES1_OWEFU|nr:unnamed protein product [Owenia fusiformis]